MLSFYGNACTVSGIELFFPFKVSQMKAKFRFCASSVAAGQSQDSVRKA